MSGIFMPFCEFYKEVFFMNEKEKIFIQDQIGYRFNNVNLLEQAFTRRSYSQENGGADNEVLEFIGDKALDLIVVLYLSNKFGSINEQSGVYESQKTESELTEMKRKLVERRALSERVEWLRLDRYLIMGDGDQKNNINEKISVKEDLFEAVFGAVALDCDWDLKVLNSVFETMHEPDSFLFDDDRDNYVSLIQEWALFKQGTVPYYYYSKNTAIWGYNNMPKVNGPVVLETVQPFESQDYYCLMKLGDYGTFFVGYGKSKSEARRKVCKIAYEHLTEQGEMNLSIQDEIENPTEQQAINQLETLARRGYFEIPEYRFVETHDSNGNPIWQAICMIDNIEKEFEAVSSSKKEAKKKAAFKMLNYVLENYDEED